MRGELSFQPVTALCGSSGYREIYQIVRHVGGIWPESVYGIVNPERWRFLEHFFWLCEALAGRS